MTLLPDVARFAALAGLTLSLACSAGGDPDLPGTAGMGTGGTGSGGLPGSGGVSGTAGTPIDPGPGPKIISQCDPAAAASVGPTPLRRISILEYNNAARDLFGDTNNPAAVSGFPSDEKVGSFITNTKTPVTATNNEGYLAAAEGIATRFVARCNSGGAACGIDALLGLARRAFHGTLDPDADTALRDVFNRATAIDASAAIEAVVRSILLSPRFLYMIEFGTEAAGMSKLSGSEVAGRLAAFLWRTVPDQELLAAADAGQLGTPEQVSARARMMLADPRGVAMLDNFALEWLDIADLTRVSRDLPEFTPTLREAMAREAQLFVGNAVATPSTRFQDLLTSTQGYANAELAAFYGVPGPANPNDFAAIQLPNGRVGVFMQAGFLTDKAHPQKPSIVLRGKAIREQLLCDRIPAPPPGVERNLTAGSGETNQDVLSQHLSSAECVACHKWLDPIGMAFDNFDQIGRFRADENGLPLVTSGDIVAGPSAPPLGTFTNAGDMMQKLSESEYVQQCFAIQTARFALGRDEQDGDACSIKSLWDGFSTTSAFSIHELFVAIAGTTAFSHRNPVRAGVACR